MANLQCIVCGRGSTRASWNNNNVYGSTNVACDFHTQTAIQMAITAGATPSSLKNNIPKPMHERETS